MDYNIFSLNEAMKELLPDGGWFYKDGVIHYDTGTVQPTPEQIDATILVVEHNRPIKQRLIELDMRLPRFAESSQLDTYYLPIKLEKEELRGQLL